MKRLKKMTVKKENHMMNKKLKKIAVSWDYEDEDEDYEDEEYEDEYAEFNYEELSPEAQKKALEELDQFYTDTNEGYFRMEDDAAAACDEGTDVGQYLQDIGIPIEDVKTIYWDWEYAWLVGKTNLNNFLDANNFSITGNREIVEWVEYFFDRYDGYFDFETNRYGVSLKDVNEEIDDMLLGDEAKELLEDIKKEVLFVLNKYDEVLSKANKYCSELLHSYYYPSKLDLIEYAEWLGIKFYSNGKIIKKII